MSVDLVFPVLPDFGPTLLHDIVCRCTDHAAAEVVLEHAGWSRFWFDEAEWFRRAVLEGRG